MPFLVLILACGTDILEVGFEHAGGAPAQRHRPGPGGSAIQLSNWNQVVHVACGTTAPKTPRPQSGTICSDTWRGFPPAKLLGQTSSDESQLRSRGVRPHTRSPSLRPHGRRTEGATLVASQGE